MHSNRSHLSRRGRILAIPNVDNMTHLNVQKRRAIFVDMAIAIGLPVLVMILRMYRLSLYLCIAYSLCFSDVVVQGHRFNILEDVGCIPTIYNTPPAYPLVFMWPVLIGCVSFCYACESHPTGS